MPIRPFLLSLQFWLIYLQLNGKDNKGGYFLPLPPTFYKNPTFTTQLFTQFRLTKYPCSIMMQEKERYCINMKYKELSNGKTNQSHMDGNTAAANSL